jgi:predicted RND superfamily exporter protein
MAGRSVGQGYFVDRLEYELTLFISVSCIFIVLFLIIAFRSAWGVIVPLVVVFLSIIWLIGTMSLTGKAIDPLLSIVPTILFVVGMSDVVHIISKYFDELRKKKGKLAALKTALREVGIATFLTSLTTAVGFLTLMSSNIMPIREFGLYSAIGVFIAYGLAFTLLPAVLVLSKAPKVSNSHNQGSFWTNKLHSLYLWVIRNRKGILVGSIVMLGLCFWGISKVQVNNELLEDLREDNPMKQEYRYFEKKYAGARPFEMSIQITDSTKNVFDWEVMQAMDKVDAFIRNEYEAGALVSPLNFVKMLNRADHSGRAEYYKIPESKGKLKKLTRDMKRMKKNEAFGQFVQEDLQRMRMTGKVGDIGAIRIREKNVLLAEFWEEHVPAGLMSYELTGMAVLIDKNNSYLSTTMVTGLLIAFLIVALIVGLMYRDIKMVIISLIPNMLPLFMIAAIMGFTGIYLKVSTSIIFTIAFGIAVDDTIHFMSKLRLELGKGRTMQYALKRTFIGTGKAIIITSLILSSGFITLTLSTFKGTSYTGSLLSLTLLFAVVADLLLIPVLVWIFYGKEKGQKNLSS